MSQKKTCGIEVEAWQSANKKKGVAVRETTVMPNSAGLLVTSVVGSQERAVAVKIQISLEEILKQLPRMVTKARNQADSNGWDEGWNDAMKELEKPSET